MDEQDAPASPSHARHAAPPGCRRASWADPGRCATPSPSKPPTCPTCGQGGVSLDEAGEQWEAAQIRQLIVRLSREERDSVIAAAQQVDDDPQTILDAMAEISPSLKMVADMARNQGSRKAAALALVMLLAWAVLPMATDARDAVNEKVESAVADFFTD